MSKHQEILDYLENLPLGKRVSVRSISNHLKVSDGTAYRAIKEAENRGLVETRPRSGTVRVDKRSKVRLDKLTYTEIARISDSQVVAGRAGLGQEFSKFSIGAMTLENIGRYLVKGGLLIVGDREDIQVLALENNNAILVTGGFPVSDKVLRLADEREIPVMITSYDTFSVATMINQALSNFRIKSDLKIVDQIYFVKENYGWLRLEQTVADYYDLMRSSSHVRFPVLDSKDRVKGVISMRDVMGQPSDLTLDLLMSKQPLTTKPEVSLATVSQKMIFEDFDMLPVVNDKQVLLGIVTRKQIMEHFQTLPANNLNTYSEQVISHLQVDKGNYYVWVEPNMLNSSGNLAQGVVTELFREVLLRQLGKKQQKNVIIEQMMLYFLEAVQIDDALRIEPHLMVASRRSASFEINLLLEDKLVVKGLITARLH